MGKSGFRVDTATEASASHENRVEGGDAGIEQYGYLKIPERQGCPPVWLQSLARPPRSVWYSYVASLTRSTMR